MTGSPPFRYDARLAREIELRWQDRWEREGTFHAANPAADLSAEERSVRWFRGGVRAAQSSTRSTSFRIPAASGCTWVTRWATSAPTCSASYLRMTGHHVLHPFGFDTFGLPAEQYAIDTGQHPAVTVRQNADVMRRQLRRLGLGHDRRREIMTSDPSYYRWTQWIFLRIFGSWYDPGGR